MNYNTIHICPQCRTVTSEIWACSHLENDGRTPWLEGLSESTWVILISCASFFSIFAWLDFLFCFVLHSCKNVPPLPGPYWLTCTHRHRHRHTHKDAHAQISHRGQGGNSERSPSQWVFQDYLDVMNKIANSIEAFRTNENYQCVTQLHFSFVCLSLEQNRFYK